MHNKHYYQRAYDITPVCLLHNVFVTQPSSLEYVEYM